jgi:hypothetical protein
MTHQDQHPRLEWLQPKAGRGEFHLVSGGRIQGILQYGRGRKERPKFNGQFGSWEIVAEGFWRRTYHLRESARQVDIASYTPKWHGAEGIIQISNGPQFTWKVTGWFKGKSAISDSSGRQIVRVRLGLESRRTRWSDWARTQGTVELDPGPYDEKILLACTVFAWFRVRGEYDDGTAGAVVAVMG